MEGGRMNSRDQQFISFDNYSDSSAGTSAQMNVDLGLPNQQLFGHLQSNATADGIMQDFNEISGQKDVPRSFWTVEYYQKFFNVDTNDVLERIKRSMIPHGVDNYLLTQIRQNPDLYGPFWICITLIFAIAISGNLANYFQSVNTNNYHWKYEFHIVSYAAVCIFLYAWLFPIILWIALKWSKSQQESLDVELIDPNTSVGLLELLCLYGYSLTIYIPVAFLWTIQIGLLQWSLVIVATILSGGVLLRSLLPLIPGKQKAVYTAVILGMHLLLAAGFMLYFFHVPSTSMHSDVTVSTTIKTLRNTKVMSSAGYKSTGLPIKSLKLTA
ncbi:PREDICTED: protein YIPF1 [Ceratosolen solmsi marchali]|uniref:Protein YIPF n=1 Tax=Ceratosolen solmsi marchali TaxID=326594 RepID=A0AAJ6VKS7_9HYME|nr:PREDICTED: protein YIPF1 [Ceratosolen solmsi marchali]